MPSTIKLGVGDDAIEVEDGASVPLLNGSVPVTTRGAVMLVVNRVLCILTDARNNEHVGFVALDPYAQIRGTGYAIDLAALRKERAPRVETVGGWATHNKPSVRLYEGRASIDDGPTYFWTHRPGNTPEKQAAFDAALDAWLGRYDAHGSSIDQIDELIKSARALGYGTQKP